MPQRPCLDCGTLSAGSRCQPCARRRQQRRDQQRGTTTQRGLGWAHRQQRTRLLAADTSGICPRCGQAYTQDNPATAEHTTARAHGGRQADALLCRGCNASAGGKIVTVRSRGANRT